MATLSRISAADAKQKVDTNLGLLVCIYDDIKFNAGAHLEGSIPMSEFLNMKEDLSKETNIIFFWAWPGDSSAAGLAVQYMENGYTNVQVLDKGIDGWKQAGFNVL